MAISLALPKQVARSRQATLKRFYVAAMIPSLAVLTVVTIIPIVYMFVTSLTPWNLARPDSFRFVGLDNYTEVLADGRFWNSIWVQLRITVFSVSFQLLLGLLLALYLYWNSLPIFAYLRSIFIVPMVIPPVVAALIWRILFTPSVSILDWALKTLNLPHPAWLSDPSLALPAIIIADIWEWTPFCLLLLLAGLQALPEEPMEAARIDGASRWGLFRHILWPLLQPTFAVVVLFRVIDSIRAFPLIYVMTEGGPGFATEATNFYAYREGFTYSDVGYSSAMVVIMFFITLAVTLLIPRVIRTEVDSG
jgi:multiple sugar transport system permease protein